MRLHLPEQIKPDRKTLGTGMITFMILLRGQDRDRDRDRNHLMIGFRELTLPTLHYHITDNICLIHSMIV